MKLFVFILLLLFGTKALAQDIQIGEILSSWALSDLSQTDKADRVYYRLGRYHNQKKYSNILKQLHNHIDHRADNRLSVRLLMQEIRVKNEYAKRMFVSDKEKVQKILQLLPLLKDDQLTAEAYYLIACSKLTKSYLFYNLKSIELQKKVGITHFYFAPNCLYGISSTLFRARNYREAINYGRQCLNENYRNSKNLKFITEIFQLDIIGNSYRKIENYDSSKYCYEKIIQVLASDSINTEPDERLWNSIAKANIGYALTLQDQPKIGIPLIKEQLNIWQDGKAYNNLATGYNMISAVYLKEKLYANALTGFKNAYKYGRRSHDLTELATASKNLANIYRITSNSDSCFYYASLYHEYQKIIDTQISKDKLSVIRGKIAFDTTKEKFANATKVLAKEKTIKNLILIATALSFVIILLFYKRKMLRQENISLQIDKSRIVAENEVKRARAKISSFADKIEDKNRLINHLQKQLQNDTQDMQVINKQLTEFILITDEEWEKFRMEFSKAYPLFLHNLNNKLTKSTPAEQRLAILIFLQLSALQISNMLGISEDSVARSKRRLKRRLALTADEKLEVFLAEFHS